MGPSGKSSFTRRSQFSSCDECRRLRVGCDAQKNADEDPTGNASQSCTRCFNKDRPCTFNWIKDAKHAAPSKRKIARARRNTDHAGDSVRPKNGVITNGGVSLTSPQSQDKYPHLDTDPQPSQVASIVADIAGPQGLQWLQNIYSDGFEAIFGSWMGRYGCPFIYGGSSDAEICVSISDICTQLDRWVAEANDQDDDAPTPSSSTSKDDRDSQLDQSLRGIIAAFAARWMPITAEDGTIKLGDPVLTRALWRVARRDMIRVMNRPSYRSMLTLFLFNLTPIPADVTEDEEVDGVSGLACVQAALQQVQLLRRRSKAVHFSGSKITRGLTRDPFANVNQKVICTPEFITAESIAYWTALTFDTSASLTLESRSFLSSGLFGFESELSWKLVRTCAQIFNDTAATWQDGSAEMTDERANEVISAAAAWKLLAWKLTAIFKESVIDGHEEVEVQRAYANVTGAIKEFNGTFLHRLDACQRRMQFLSQQTKLRWYHLMLHYNLSILILADIIQAANRTDLLEAMSEAHYDAENAVMNTLVYGLQNTYTLTLPDALSTPTSTSISNSSLESSKADSNTLKSITLPLVAVDPYSHHIVASIHLVQRAIDRDRASGRMSPTTHQNLHDTLGKILGHLPQTSKSILSAVEKYRAERAAEDMAAVERVGSVVVQAEYVSPRVT